MAHVHPKKKSELSRLAEESSKADERNKDDWHIASHYGITQQALEQRHPEVAKSQDDLSQTIRGAVRKAKWAVAVAGVAGAAVALVFPKWSAGPKKWGRRAVAAVFTGISGVGLGIAGAVMTVGKSVMKKTVDVTQQENAALEQEIMTVAVKNSGPPVVGDAKNFTAGIVPRDASYTGQAAADAAKPASPSLA